MKHQRVGAPTKLTPEVIERLCAAARLGVSNHRAALAVGVSERTYQHWRRRADEAGDVLPPDWRQHTIGELQRFAAELDLDESDMKVRRGKRSVPGKADWIALLEENWGRYYKLFEALQRARVHGEIANLRRLEESAAGGRIIVKKKTKETYARTEDGAEFVVKKVVETSEHAADMSTRDAKWLLARLHGYERGAEKVSDKTPRELAAEIAEAVRAMQETIGMGLPAADDEAVA